MENLSELESSFLFLVCRRWVSVDLHSGNPVSLKYFKTYFSPEGTSMYSIRKAVKRLKELGLIFQAHTGGQTEDGKVYCINGYCLTKKGTQTKECKQAWEEERQICENVFGFDIGTLEQEIARSWNNT